MLNKNGNVQAFCGLDTAYEDADIVLFGAPFDGTTSNRPGARFAPAAIRSESVFGIEPYSLYQDKDLTDSAKVYDAGDLALPKGCAAAALDAIEDAAAQILKDGKMPLMLGGDHLVTLGAVRAAAKKYPLLHIIHLDAHSDLSDKFSGEELSHATVMRRCYEILGDGRIFQFGIRSGARADFAWAKGRVFQQNFGISEFGQIAEKLVGAPVYFSLDVDVLDPSVLPGTGTPEAGGPSFMELFSALLCLKNLQIAGCDIVELAPNLDASGVSTATTCKILRELLLVLEAAKN